MSAPSLVNHSNCFAYPALGLGNDFGLVRFGGSGLANLLFTWAHCLVRAEEYGLLRIQPTWFQICRAPWLRNFPDKRTYHDLFSPAPGEITGLRRLHLLATHPRVPETKLGSPVPDGSIVVFSRVVGLSRPVLNRADLVREELFRITRPAHTGALRENFRPGVAIHVRLGDFGTSNPSANNLVNTRIDIHWYIGILQELRANLGPLQAAVFSDGTDEELAPLLSLPDVRRVTFGSGIADIIALSRARILVASGSTFSLWASFLGQNPTVWFPGMHYQSVQTEPAREASTLRELPLGFLLECRKSLDPRALREQDLAATPARLV
jgi:hypothetical protein